LSRNTFFAQLYFSARFFQAGIACAASFLIAWLFDLNLQIPISISAILLVLILADFLYLYFPAFRFTCKRIIAQRFSNSDPNPVTLQVWHNYPFPLLVNIFEELPEQFQARTNHYSRKMQGGKRHSIQYSLRPVHRGDYRFENTICMLQTALGLVQRRIVTSEPVNVKVYPSFLQLRQFRLMANTAQILEKGTIQLRKIGHSLEFEHIKEYVQGDDRRAVNWKATARKANLMVNHFMDERSQQVYCVIDKGRLMKMPFKGLSLLDYAINSSLVLASVALHRQDRFGMLTFSHKAGEFIAADRKSSQLRLIQESLYRISTEFLESDFEKLYLQLRTMVRQRSLLVLFTNFESITGMRRQLPYLLQLAKHHLLLVVFFENTELVSLSHMPAQSLPEVYTSAIAGKFVFEKKLIVKELLHHGIMSILTAPENLTVQTVNKYIELKTRQAI
jgi:uncharacterized protein (DUF58 family)